MVEVRELYSLKDISNLTNISERTLRKLVAEGILVNSSNGRKMFFTFDAFLSMLKNPKVTSILNRKKMTMISEYTSASIRGHFRRFAMFELPQIDDNSIKQLFEISLLLSKICISKTTLLLHKNVFSAFYCFDFADFQNPLLMSEMAEMYKDNIEKFCKIIRKFSAL